MAWRDNLHLDGKGSFRGVEFFVSSVDSEIGRRVVLHEYPGRDVPSTEDLGRASRRFRLTCYVVGPQYDFDRDLLRTEFETAGSGQLVHPYWGEMTVTVVSPVRIRETTDEGGMARFDLEVVEITGVRLTQVQPDLEPLVADKADAALVASGEVFEDEFSIVGAIEAVRSQATSAIQTMAQGLRAARAAANAAINLVDDVGDAIGAFIDAAASLINTPAALVSAAQGLYADVYGGLARLDAATADLVALGARFTAAADGGRLFEDYRADRTKDVLDDTLDTGATLGEVTLTGSGQAQIESDNQAAIIQFFDAATVIEACRAFSVFEFDSRDKVLEIRDALTDAIDDLNEDAPDQLWAAMTDLQVAVAARLLEIAEALPNIVEVTPKITQPALVLAYNIHGDATREAELVARNNLFDPNFVPGSIPIKVVADG